LAKTSIRHACIVGDHDAGLAVGLQGRTSTATRYVCCRLAVTAILNIFPQEDTTMRALQILSASLLLST
jgi:hypothetical protein